MQQNTKEKLFTEMLEKSVMWQKLSVIAIVKFSEIIFNHKRMISKYKELKNHLIKM